MDKPERYIPKEELEIGALYNGIFRKTNIAMWDGECFLFKANKFIDYIDKCQHFDDVKDKGISGFVPLEKIDLSHIEHPKLQEWYNEFKLKIGY